MAVRSSGTRSTRFDFNEELDMRIVLSEGLVNSFGDVEGVVGFWID